MENHPILFVFPGRAGFPLTSDRIRATAREQHGERNAELRLGPLDREACRLLINNLFRHSDIPHAVRTMVAEKAGGNPFYV